MTLGALALLSVALIVVSPANVHAQDSGLKVTITRPGAGETLYASPTSPFVTAQVMGRVSTNDFPTSQLQLRLELFQGAKSFGSTMVTPQPDGSFSFTVAINPERPATKSSGEYGCNEDCHANTALGLPAGHVLLRVTATDPLGRKATAERSVICEYSGYADVPVQVVSAENPKGIAGLTIVADTLLYMWRARQYSVRTNATGTALLHVEALGQTPTRYSLHIEPIVLDGVLYKSREPLQVVIPAGTPRAAPITLVAEPVRGQIEGTIDPKGFVGSAGAAYPSGLSVRAVDLSSGRGYTTKTAQGKFTFSGLPIGKYLVAVEDQAAMAQTVDLTASPVASTTLNLLAAPTHSVKGAVKDNSGNPLPLAWIATEDRKTKGRVAPLSGEFSMAGLAPETRALWVTAPGYWSRPVALFRPEGLCATCGGDSAPQEPQTLRVSLTPQPETRFVPWGAGTITLPAQLLGNLSGNRLSLKRGWVWGKGSGPFFIATPDLEITLQSGSFALEYLPGEKNWLYVPEGQAQVMLAATDETLTVSAGQMLAFGKGVERPSPVAMDDAAIRLLHIGGPSPVATETDSAPLARVRDELERLGIPFALAIQIAALLVVALGLIGVKKTLRVMRLRRSRRNP